MAEMMMTTKKEGEVAAEGKASSSPSPSALSTGIPRDLLAKFEALCSKSTNDQCQAFRKLTRAIISYFLYICKSYVPSAVQHQLMSTLFPAHFTSF